MSANITTPRFARMLQRMFSAHGGDTGVLLSDVMPVAEVMDPAELALKALRGELAFGQFVGTAAVAGSYGSCQLANPVASGTLITLESFIIMNADAAVQQYAFSLDASAATSGWVAQPRDSRLLIATGPPNTVGALSASADAAVPSANSGFVYVPATGVYSPPSNISWVLGPGSVFTIHCMTVNKVVNMTFFWTERQCESEELQRIR